MVFEGQGSFARGPTRSERRQVHTLKRTSHESLQVSSSLRPNPRSCGLSSRVADDTGPAARAMHPGNESFSREIRPAPATPKELPEQRVPPSQGLAAQRIVV